MTIEQTGPEEQPTTTVVLSDKTLGPLRYQLPEAVGVFPSWRGIFPKDAPVAEATVSLELLGNLVAFGKEIGATNARLFWRSTESGLEASLFADQGDRLLGRFLLMPMIVHQSSATGPMYGGWPAERADQARRRLVQAVGRFLDERDVRTALARYDAHRASYEPIPDAEIDLYALSALHKAWEAFVTAEEGTDEHAD